MKTKARPNRGELYEIAIDRLAYGGNGVGRLANEDGGPGMAVFVPRSAPGDQLRVRIDRVRRRHAEASIETVLEAGPARREPVCQHYEEGCGGCSWQHLAYADQLGEKERMVADCLTRIGGLEGISVEPIVAADDAWYYRNKMDFTFHDQDGLGLHFPGDWRRILPITDCRLESELAMRVVAFVGDFVNTHGLSRWNPVRHDGLMRDLVIRHGRASGETMVGIVTSGPELPRAQELAQGIVGLDPTITSVVHAIRDGVSDGSPVERVRALHGRETIVERVAGLSFNIGLQTFFQTSTAQAERMLEIVRERVTEALAEGPPRSILDVFCGVGFLTLGVADLAEHAVGVEIVEASIVAARENARFNAIENVSFYAGDARRKLPEVIEAHGMPGVVIIDPPRSGAGGKVMRRLARSQPERLVYVSCNPTTLARDLLELQPFGYRVTEVQPIDLFPQTYHVETIVTLDRAATS